MKKQPRSIFIQDIRGRYSSDVSTLELGNWVNELEVSNLAFESMINQRYDQSARQEVINLRETRKEIDHVYHQLIDRFNAYMLLHGNDEYGGLASLIDERVGYYKNTLQQRKGKAAAKKQDAATEKN